MLISTLIANIRNPPNDSVVGHMTRSDGRTMRLLPFVILVNWLVFHLGGTGTAVFQRGHLPTLISVPFSSTCHVRLLLWRPESRPPVYLAGVFALSYILARGTSLAGLPDLRILHGGVPGTAAVLVTIIIGSIFFFVLEMWLLVHR